MSPTPAAASAPAAPPPPAVRGRLHRGERAPSVDERLRATLPPATEARRALWSAMARRTAAESDLQRERRGTPAPDLVQRVAAARADEESALAALREREPSAVVDPHEWLMVAGDLAVPWVDPRRAKQVAVESDILALCIGAVARGIVGNGYTLEPFYSDEAIKKLKDDDEAAAKAYEEEADAEKRRLARFFRFANPERSFFRLLLLALIDRGATGQGYLEVIPDAAGNIAGFAHLPSPDCHLSRLSDVVDDATMPVQGDDGRWTTVVFPRRFRRICQRVNGMDRWFKAFGDLRVVDRVSGQAYPATEAEVDEVRKASTAARAAVYLDTGNDVSDIVEQRAAQAVATARDAAVRTIARRMLDDGRADTIEAATRIVRDAAEVVRSKRAAHEVIVFLRDEMGAGLTAYGIPDWWGARYSLLGRMAAAQVNFNYFDNNAIPDLIVMVDGGSLTSDAQQQVEDLMRGTQGRDRFRGTALVLDAVPASANSNVTYDGERGPPVKVHTERLRDGGEDALFKGYSGDTREDVRRVHRLPPVLIGDSSDYTRATAEVARDVSEALVFRPERLDIEFLFNNVLFPRLGINFWTFKLLPATVVNVDLVNGLLATATEHGAIFPDELRVISSKLLGHPLTPTGKPWMQRPSMINKGLAADGVDFTAENAPSAPLVPLSPNGTVGNTGAGAAAGGDDGKNSAEADEAASAAGADGAAADAPDEKRPPAERRIARVAIPAEFVEEINREVAEHGRLAEGGRVVRWLMDLREELGAAIAREREAA